LKKAVSRQGWEKWRRVTGKGRRAVLRDVQFPHTIENRSAPMVQKFFEIIDLVVNLAPDGRHRHRGFGATK
jgi:hypothetical protein